MNRLNITDKPLDGSLPSSYYIRVIHIYGKTTISGSRKKSMSEVLLNEHFNFNTQCSRYCSIGRVEVPTKLIIEHGVVACLKSGKRKGHGMGYRAHKCKMLLEILAESPHIEILGQYLDEYNDLIKIKSS